MIPRALILLPLILFVACSMSAKFGEGPQAPYQKVTALEDVPEPAKRVLGFYAPNPRDRIADSDSNFTAGCTPLPDHSNRRLVLAGLADDHVLIVQEKGGRAYQVEALQINHLQQPARITKRWHLEKRPNSIAETLRLIKAARKNN